MKLNFGNNIYGLGAIALGIITLVWRQIDLLGSLSHTVILVYIVGIVELIGGLAIQWDRTLKYGAAVLAAVYLIFTLYLIPPIVEMPLVYSNWGNFFEELSIVLGGVIVFASAAESYREKPRKILRAAYICFGICVTSYSLYQLFYLSYTANLVPKWIPPGQMFWAVATSIAFAAAAYAILSGRSALLASRLLVIMFIGFCVFVWSPVCLNSPYGFTGWNSNAVTLAVAGSVWIFADFIYKSEAATQSLPVNSVLLRELTTTQ